MNDSRHARLTKAIGFAPTVASCVVAAIALLVLVGWALDIEPLRSFLHPGHVAMNPVSAVAFLLAAAGLWSGRRETPVKGVGNPARWLGVCVVVIAVCRLASYALGLNLPVDQLLFRSRLAGNVMAPNTAAAFLLCGLALLLDAQVWRRIHPAQWLLVAVGVVAALSLTGYLYKMAALYDVRGFIPMSLNTAIAFAVLSVGALCARPSREPVSTAISPTLGGVVARRLIPAAFLVPLLIGWIELQGEQRGLFAPAFGRASLVLANVLVFNVLIWSAARALRINDLRRKAIEEQLRGSEERYHAVIEQAAEGIYLVDLQTRRVLDSNAAIERLLGYEHGEAEGRSVYDFIDDTPENIDRRLAHLAESGETLRGERTYLRKDGSKIEVQASATVISYAGRRVSCTVVHDITARKRAQREAETAVQSERKAHEELKETQSQLVQSEKLAGLGQMVAGVAHEINNPLSFVGNNIAVLQRDVRGLCQLLALYGQSHEMLAANNVELHAQIAELSERIDLAYTRDNIQDLIDRSRDGLRRIQQIVKDLRDFARLDESDLHEVDLNAGIQSTVNIVQGTAKKKRVQIDLELGGLPLVSCYPAKINQVVMNLVANAIDACPEGGRVIVRTSAESAGVRIVVSDNGTGVDPSIRHRIFDPFFTTKPQGQGTGLGLSISYGIVRDHGGSIEVSDAPGGGAVFTVMLPIRASVLRK